MALQDYKRDLEMCSRCSACKFIPLERIKGERNVSVCPSIDKFNFHAYSGGGKVNIAEALLEGRLEINEKFLDIVYNCQMCGGCDVSCKYGMDMELLEPLEELRIRCVEEGRSLPALDRVIESLKTKGSMAQDSGVGRGEWAAGLGVATLKEKPAEVVFHAGCRTCFNKCLWDNARNSVSLLKAAQVDVAILGGDETCCGGRAYDMGYKDAFLEQAGKYMNKLKNSGCRVLVTGCAECYSAFKVYYDKFDLIGDIEVLHITEYLARLIKEGKLVPKKEVNAAVTYHDPCNLGRKGEPYVHWSGKEADDIYYRFEPPKPYRRGKNGVYEPPREILAAIPGVELVEMDRIREYAWCCGSGGGVRESNPDFALWTAEKRIEEAEETGAGIIATACPGCIMNLNEAIEKKNSRLKVCDVISLLAGSVL